MTTWILVADDSRAFVYAGDSTGLERLAVYDHPASRARGVDLKSDGPGRTQPRNNGLARRASMHATHPAEVEADRFARQVAEALRQAQHQGVFDALVVVTPPQFLGRLRSHLHDGVLATIERTVPKDLTTLPRDELERRLPELLPT